MPDPRKGERRAGADEAPKPEFSRPVDVSRIGRLEYRIEIAADAEERAALARRFDLVAVTELSAALVLEKRGDGVVEVAGRYRARVAQRCVATLEPVPATIDEEVRLFFGGPLGAPSADLDPFDDAGWTEPIERGRIDLGEAVTQLMALALDPYPRLADDRGRTGDG